MATHENQEQTNSPTGNLLANASVLELLRIAFNAGYAAAQQSTFHVADAGLQVVLDRIKHGIEHNDQEDSASGVRSGGDW